ncbi:phage tail protein [Microbacterium sp. No. 7]|uniref:phage tail protein n=1 Tax=Microbacterium sp. No. 7 TaxID=1714373 RepID=UPI0006ED2148|nr:tail fiber protein [Microbacterium sp. No. 7]ALJ19574.1 hypothetical protein AOA12_06485 [Microbacterium sp. No. 7]
MPITPGGIFYPGRETPNDPTVWAAQMAHSMDTAGAAPPGAVVAFASNTIPNNWLLCNGQSVSRTTYSNLFAAIGTTYGAGNGSTTFGLPDMRGRVIAGRNTGDSDFSTLNHKNGAKTHTLSINEMPQHRHTGMYKFGGQMLTWRDTTGSGTLGGVRGSNDGEEIFTGLTGGTMAHNNLQPYIVLNWIIRT